MIDTLSAINDDPVTRKLFSFMLALITAEFVLAELAGLITLVPRLHSLPALKQFNLIASIVLVALPWVIAAVGQRAVSRQAGLFKDVLEQPTLLRLWNVCLGMISLAYVVFFAGLSLGAAS